MNRPSTGGIFTMLSQAHAIHQFKRAAQQQYDADLADEIYAAAAEACDDVELRLEKLERLLDVLEDR